ncbi:winged helix-turn-helix domain-containing protein [Methanosarcina sp. KYL-1]|uniref:helix-turn-helix transcriptional regulator n=1 Tax=Methanosarcina sp. KYL-1 TaxID=2602068 RepID=UPI002101AC90|nr:winged helix-turn-helix domain-containing protein [Methanosarcina sp. KYL-1]
MKSKLLDTIFFSEKRKDLLLFLADGPKSTAEIKEAFDFPWKSMIPQIKQLLKTGLLEKEGDMYRLSGMGPVVVANMKHLLGALELYEEDMDYWKNHDLSSLPSSLGARLGELGNCSFVPLKNEGILHQAGFLNEVLASSRVLFFASAFYSELPFIYSELTGRGIKTSIIISETVFKDMKEELFEDKNPMDLKNPVFGMLFEEYRKEAGRLLDRKNPDVFVYGGSRVPAAVLLTDKLLMVVLYGKPGVLPNRCLLSKEPGALKWGEELFIYYMKESRHISSCQTHSQVSTHEDPEPRRTDKTPPQEISGMQAFPGLHRS